MIIKYISIFSIVFCTISIIWLLFISPKDEIADPISIFYDLYYLLGPFISSPPFLLAMVIIIIFFIIIQFHLVIFSPLLNKCEYCGPLREDSPPFLVNGYCKNCDQHLCSKCFYFVKKGKKKVGCPNSNCSGSTFIRKNSLGYARLPSFIRNWVIENWNQKRKQKN